MKLSGPILVCPATFGFVLAAAQVAAAVRRNEAFSPPALIAPTALQPAAHSVLQEKRAIHSPTMVKSPAAVGDRRAVIGVTELRAKKVVAPASRRPEAHPFFFGPTNRQPAVFTTVGAGRQPALVAKYQDRLSAAGTVTIGRTPAVDRGGAAKLNRFVFRPTAPAPWPAPVPAAPVRAVSSDGR